jgi:hypothetical protein
MAKSAFVRILSWVSAIEGARQATKVFADQGTHLLAQDAQAAVSLIYRSSLIDEKSRAAIDELIGGFDGGVDKAVQHQRSSLLDTVDAASLVFMHSMLEDLVYECLQISMQQRPERWDHRLARKKIELRDIQSSSYEAIREGLLDRELKRIKKAPLLENVDCLLEVAQPDQLSHEGYTYDRSRLESIDRRRHLIVHESGPTPVPDIAEELQYLEDTAYNLLAMAATEFDAVGRLFLGKAD